MLHLEVMHMDEWLTVAEVATDLKVTTETVRRWLREGKLQGAILSDRGGWRVRRSEVDAFMVARGGDRRAEDLRLADVS